jgi:hypothetical protein
MSQINRTAAQAPVISLQEPASSRRALAAVGAAIALAAAGIALALVLTTSPAVPQGARTSTGELTDGYLSGAVTAHSAVQAENAQALTDGWASRLVVSRTAPGAVRDGWEAGLLR